MVNKKGGLGKGLEALLGNNAEDEKILKDRTKIVDVDINKVCPNKLQPRKNFDEKSLNELAESMNNVGIIQPITVKKVGNNYEIITGERRWRAAKIAKLKTVPIIIKDYSEMEILEVSLIENIQRENLNPIEEALTYKRFSDEFKLSQDEIGKKVGKSRAAVANTIRLLNLDERVQRFLIEGKISNGHARALLGTEDKKLQFTLSEKIIEEKLSVREIEQIIANCNKEIKNEEELKPKNQNTDNDIYSAIANDLKTILGTKVLLKNGKNKGKIEIEYYSDDELDRLIGLFKKIY